MKIGSAFPSDKPTPAPAPALPPVQVAGPAALAKFTDAQRLTYKRSAEAVRDLTQRITAQPITTVQDQAALNELLGHCKSAIADIEHARKLQVEPLNKQLKSINDAWRTPREALEKLEKAAKAKLLASLQAEAERKAREQEARRLAAEEALRLEAEAMAAARAAQSEDERQQALANAEAAAAALALTRTAELEEAPRGIKSDSATSSIRETWTFQVVDLGKVPRNFLALDEKAVRGAIAAGARHIEGLQIYTEQGITTRGRG